MKHVLKLAKSAAQQGLTEYDWQHVEHFLDNKKYDTVKFFLDKGKVWISTRDAMFSAGIYMPLQKSSNSV